MNEEPGDDDAELVVTGADGVAVMWLNRPARRNAVTLRMWRQIADRCEELAGDAGVRVLVLRGRGEHFCAGADITGLGEESPDAYAEANERAEQALAGFPKPTIAHVRGSCVGGGVQLAVACDLRICDDSARFGITPARLGIVYPASSLERVVRLVGPSAALHLIYTAELIDSRRAERIGLVDERHEGAACDARVEDLVDLIAHRRSLLTQMAAKEMLGALGATGRIDQTMAERWAQEMAAGTDAVEGVAAFLEHRRPSFAWTPISEDPL